MTGIPVSWALGAVPAAGLIGTVAGWTVRDWRYDSKALADIEVASRKLDQARIAVDRAANAYEQEKTDASARTQTRESTIREIYRDRMVPADCAAPDAARRLLDDAVSDASARAAGKPSAGLPGLAPAAGPAD